MIVRQQTASATTLNRKLRILELMPQLNDNRRSQGIIWPKRRLFHFFPSKLTGLTITLNLLVKEAEAV